MKATITVEDQSGHIFCQSVIEEAHLEHLFDEFRATVEDFRSVSKEHSWEVRVRVEDDSRSVRVPPKADIAGA